MEVAPQTNKNRQLGRVALSCHIAVDMLCQEMQEAWQLGCFCQRGLLVTARMPFSHRGPAATTIEREVVREMKEKERERRALRVRLACQFLPILIQLKHGERRERGRPFPLFNVVCFV